MIYLLAINFFISLLLTLSARILLHKLFKHHTGWFYAYIFLFACFLPIVGGLIGLFIVTFVYIKHTNFHEHAELIDDTMNLEDIQPLVTKYGSGGARRQLLNQLSSKHQRTDALFKIAQSQSTDVNLLFYQLLPDTSDEIRLLAFSILDEQENRLTKSIHEVQTLLQTHPTGSKTYAQLEKNIAQLYWEQAYQHLIITELEHALLEKAHRYALSASHLLIDDASLWILLGKIYTRLKQYSQAEASLDKARKLKAAPIKIYPYLAEIYFNKRDYPSVKKYLSISASLNDIYPIASVINFWDTGVKDEFI